MNAFQAQLHNAVTSFWKEHGYGPSFYDLAAAVGLSSPNSVYNRVRRMVDLGLLAIDKGKKRTIRPTGRCPCCGRAD